MPPHVRSRYLATLGLRDSSDRLYLTERTPFRYDPTLPGTRRHTVAQGDRLWHLAYRYFKPFPNAEHLWWVIAEFQPQPILDPTLDLDVGRVLFVPSGRVMQERILTR
jgi:hypothetical protein